MDKKERLQSWAESFQAGYDYLILHRKCVVQMGKTLNIHMADHDLTKTRLVQIALGYMWHWGESDKPDTEYENNLEALGTDAIAAGHLELENHHPQYKGKLVVEHEKLFVDRLSVHLQKDERDDMGGWAIKHYFIPAEYKVEWEAFKAKYEQINLNEQVWDVVIKIKNTKKYSNPCYKPEVRVYMDL